MTRRTLLLIALCSACLSLMASQVYCDDAPSGIKIATFDLDATPPVGAMMAYNPVRRVRRADAALPGNRDPRFRRADRAVCSRLDRP